MARQYWFLLLAGVVLGLIISGRYALHAQERAEPAPESLRPVVRENPADASKENVNRELLDERQPATRAVNDRTSAVPIQESLLRPYRFPFSRPTSLEQVSAPARDTQGIRGARSGGTRPKKR